MEYLARTLDTMARSGRPIDGAKGTRLCRGFRRGYQTDVGSCPEAGMRRPVSTQQSLACAAVLPIPLNNAPAALLSPASTPPALSIFRARVTDLLRTREHPFPHTQLSLPLHKVGPGRISGLGAAIFPSPQPPCLACSGFNTCQLTDESDNTETIPHP